MQWRNGHPCLVPGFSDNPSKFFSFNIMLTVGLLCTVFIIMLRHLSFILSVFKDVGGHTLPKAFSASTEMTMWFLSLTAPT